MSQSLPGLYHTQGDRVVEALMRLYLKIQQVDQAYLELLKSETEVRTDDQKSKGEIHESLEVARARCQLLEQQLHHVRNMLANAENARLNKSHDSADGRTTTAHSEPTTSFSAGDNHPSHAFLKDAIHSTHSKTSSMECLGGFKKTREPQGVSRSKGTVNSSPVQSSSAKLRPSSRKRTKSLNDIPSARAKSKNFIHHHYHLQLNDIPFVLGTATSASHSIIANLQNFIAMLKQHNPRICSSVGSQNVGAPRTSSARSSAKNTVVDTASLILELKDLIHGLEVEHDIISDEKAKLMEQLRHADLSESDLKTKHEIEALMIRLLVKEEQISRLRTIQILLEENRRACSQNSSGNSMHFRSRDCSERSVSLAKESNRISGNRRRLLNELRHLQRSLREEQMQ